MNVKRAIWMSILAGLVIFLGDIALGWILGFNIFLRENVNLTMQYLLLIKTFIIVTLVTFWYFQDKRIIASAKEGMIFGLILAGASIVMDFILSFTFAMVFYQFSNFLNFYLEWTVIASYPLSFVTAATISYMVGLSRSGDGEPEYHLPREGATEQEESRPVEIRDGRPKKVVGLIMFAWGLVFVSLPGSFRVIGAVFLVVSIYLYLRAARQKGIVGMMLGINALVWGLLQLLLYIGGFYVADNISIVQQYISLLLMSLVFSLLLLGWVSVSKKR